MSLPRPIPLVILRGSGRRRPRSRGSRPRTACGRSLTPRAAASSTSTARASREKALALAEASLDRLGVCNRLNLALVDREAAALVAPLLALFARAGPRGARRRRRRREPLDRPLGHEWASDPERVATVTIALVDGLDEAVRVANEQTSGLAAGIVAEDAEAAERFLDGYRGTAAFWHATTRFTDGFELTGAPETGINVDWAPGPRGPGHVPRPLAPPVPHRRRRHRRRR